MKKVHKKYTPHTIPQAGVTMDLASYRKTSVNSIDTKHIRSETSPAPLTQILTMAAFMLSPLAAQAQCLINSQSIDVDNDGNADIVIYSTFRTNGYQGAIRSINQVRARALDPNNQLTFFGTQFFPRSCYNYSCIFPTPDGALSGVNMGSVAVLQELINSCNSVTTQVKSTYTYTISGNTYTNCTYFTTFTTYCYPTLVNGNFNINGPGTLGFKLNGEDHFIELTVDSGIEIHKIDGVESNPCDPGCQDTLELICNEVFPVDSYHAENEIITNDIVDTNQMVELAAGFEIEFLPGFEVIRGGELIAEIDTNCN